MSTDALTLPQETALAEEPYADVRRMVEREFIGTDGWAIIDDLDAAMEAHPDRIDSLPLNHILTDGIYCRQIFMPAGTKLTTRVHLTEHPYFISTGVVAVWEPVVGWTVLRAYHQGITQPGTRRILWVLEDCVWTTVHRRVDDETDPQKIVDALTYDHRKLRLNERPQS